MLFGLFPLLYPQNTTATAAAVAVVASTAAAGAAATDNESTKVVTIHSNQTLSIIISAFKAVIYLIETTGTSV